MAIKRITLSLDETDLNFLDTIKTHNNYTNRNINQDIRQAIKEYSLNLDNIINIPNLNKQDIFEIKEILKEANDLKRNSIEEEQEIDFDQLLNLNDFEFDLKVKLGELSDTEIAYYYKNKKLEI